MNSLPLWKNKRLYWSLTLGLILLLQIGFFSYLEWHKIPSLKTELQVSNKNLETLEMKKNELYDTSGITELLEKYEERANELKTFQDSRKNVFYFADAEKFDFFPPLVDIIIPAVTKHIHNEVTLEGVSINEEAEVILPIYAKSYTHLAKQYAAIKYAFESEPAPLFTNIKLNTFTRQELEIIDRNAQGQFTKRREKIIKATVVAQINPEYFVQNTSNESFETEEFESFISNQKKENIFQKILRVTTTTSRNIKLSTLALIENIQSQFSNTEFTKIEEKIPESAEVEITEEVTEEPEEGETEGEEAIPEETIKEIITTSIPSFQLNGATWSRVPTKMSEFLAAGKTLVAGELSLSPYQSYTEEELKNTAIDMMNAIIDASGTVTFHQKNFDVNTFEGEIIDLIELNNQ